MQLRFLFFLFLFLVSVKSFPLINKKERYIIQLKKPDSVEDLCSQDDAVKSFSHLRPEIKKVFSFGKFEGLVGEFSKDVIERIANNPLIEKITQDFNIEAFDDTVIQEDAPFHLVRLSQDDPVQEAEDTDYYYSEEYQGEDVIAYIIDTGVFVQHPEFEGRAELGPNFSSDFRNIDYSGHGTHVAGIMGSKTYGVAKKINLHSIKVLDRNGHGSLSSVIAGLEYAVNHKNKNGLHGVANLSLGSTKSSVLDAAIKEAYLAGLLVVVAAGNNGMDACLTSPAGSRYALTVGAIDDKTDLVAHFSNWGKCVDVFASGVEVESTTNRNNQIRMLSGTSMASPVVAGLVGILLEKGINYQNILQEIKDISIRDAIPPSSFRLRKGTPNIIVNNGVREYGLIMRQNQTMTMP